jgi:murein DD-endopeptidase MepM/ murein hydrolase activator NlpD
MEEVPIIDPNSPELLAALTALPPAKTKDAKQAATRDNSDPVWPIHGAITTNFGVPHWPYQATHTGLDISDGQASGVTPVKPFRPGRVVDVVASGSGLGNHVVVDHGQGVTSVYAHLASISVKVGQKVAQGTTLGLEGSTGASTGTHLHFEIRVHGRAADPHRFINGQP